MRYVLFLAFGAALCVAAPQIHAQEIAADVLIRGGTVVDGTGSAARQADVAVRGDRIVFIGNAGNRVRAAQTINASGMIVAPGGVDPHAHVTEDLSDSADAANLPFLMQGVTTVITGNDGHGTHDVGRLMTQWERHKIGTNAALLVGHGAVRRQVMGMSSAAPTASQLDSMRTLVRQAMESGALGLSSGLFYAPGSFSETEEVIELAKVAAAYGGLYDSHTRDESSYGIGLVASVAEAIRVGRESGAPVNISHIKALGVDVWGKSDSVIKLVEAARASGMRVTADQYPYTASGTSIGASMLPRWTQSGGSDSVRARLADPALRPRIEREMLDNMRRRGGAASLLITSSRDSSIRGKTLLDVAKARGTDTLQTAIDIILAGGAGVASFNMNEDDIKAFMKQDWVATGSDGSGGHPRKYGTFPRKLRRYVYDEPVITLPAAIRASSSITARQFGLAERGELREGWYADVIVFDPATIRDVSTFEEPELLATGVKHVLVNGVMAVKDGEYTGVRPGRVLRGQMRRSADGGKN
jgi:N-acyl-D-aspartate/D-glutamate deacylase